MSAASQYLSDNVYHEALSGKHEHCADHFEHTDYAHTNDTNSAHDANLNHDQNAESEREPERLSLHEYLYTLCHEYREDIMELSRENGYPLNKASFTLWNLRESIMKVVEIPSDSKLSELLSLHFHTVASNQSTHDYKEKLYYYLNIQLNATQCIHVRILSKDSHNEIQAILYKSVQDKLRQF